MLVLAVILLLIIALPMIFAIVTSKGFQNFCVILFVTFLVAVSAFSIFVL